MAGATPRRDDATGDDRSIAEVLKKVRRIEITTRRMVNDVFSGEYHSVFKGQGMEFDEVREYQPGDDIRAIDWNVTARMGAPYIKRFMEERELVVTFLLTVFVDLTVALQVGVVLASFLFMRRMAAVSDAGYVRGMLGEGEDDGQESARLAGLEVPDGVEMFKVYGTLFFGAASKFKDALRRVEKPPKVLIQKAWLSITD